VVAAIVGGLALIGLVGAGVIVVPRMLDGVVASPTASPTVDMTAVPPVGVCYAEIPVQNPNGGAEVDTPVSCDEPHHLETIAARGVEDAGPNPPAPAEELTRTFFQDCVDAADLFLGAHFRTTYTQLVLSLPSPTAWRAGAHWYRCDLGTKDDFFGSLVPTTGSLADLARPITCLTWNVLPAGGLTNVLGADCDEVHEAEVVGAFIMPDFDADAWESAEMFDLLNLECYQLAEQFLDQSRVDPELTIWFFYPSGDQTDLDQSAVCAVAALDGRRFVDSLEGVGSGPLPFA
jgi:hypothetical protein